MTQQPLSSTPGILLRPEHLPDEVRLAGLGGGRGFRGALSEKLAGGSWFVQQVNADEQHLLRDLGFGYYAAHTLRVPSIASAVPGPATNGGLRRAACLTDMGVGRLMTYAPLNAGTFVGSWSGSSANFAAVVPDITEGVDLVTPLTITTTAGSTAATGVSPVVDGTNTRWSGRRIVIPGAGAAGADYVGTIANTGGGGATLTLSPAAATAVTNAQATLYPKRHFAAHTATATYTAPVGADSVGVVYGVAGNGGLWTVSIDGDLTRADCLPTAQRLVDLELAPASILTTHGGTIAPNTRCLDFYDPTEVFTLYQALATGLDTSVAHTVVLSSTTQRRTGSNNSRGILAGFGYGTPTLAPGTAGVRTFYTTRVSQPFPTHELAIDHRPTGATSSVFVGGNNHGYEYAPAPVLVVDGATVTLNAGEVRPVGSSATITVRSLVYHSQVTTTATPTFAVDREYRLDRDGLTVRQAITVRRATTVASAYLAMFTVDADLDRVQLERHDEVLDLSDFATHAPNSYLAVGKHTGAVWWDPRGTVAAAVFVPTAEQMTDGWSDGIMQATVRQLAEGSKFYVRRVGVFVPGEVLAGRATYVLSRLPDGARRYLPLV